MCLRRQDGLTVVGILIGLLLSAALLTAGLSTLSTSSGVQNQQDIAMAMEQNLRVALNEVSDSLTMAGSGVPVSNLDLWIPWVANFTENPKIGTSPLTISEAHCTSVPIFTVASVALAGDTTITVSNPTDGSGLGDAVNPAEKRLIAIDDETFADITDVDVANTLLTIDTDPTQIGDQGLPRSFPVGTPICRVDVSTFSVDAVADRLGVDLHDGYGPKYFAEQISGVQITTLVTDLQYEVIVNATSERADPSTGSPMTGTLRRVVTLRN